MDSSSSLSPSNTNTSSSGPAQQVQQFQGQMLYEFPENYSDPMFNAMAAGMDMSVSVSVSEGRGMLEDQQFPAYDVQTMPPLEELTTLPEWFFPSANGPPVQDFDMGFFNTDDVINFSGI
jgi:hypothetical protein